MLQMWVGQKVRLRAFRPDDMVLWGEFRDDSAMQRTGSDITFPRSPESLRRRLEKEIEEGKDPGDDVWMIIEARADGRVVGNVGLFGADRRNRTTMFGISLWDRSAWGQGYASEALRLLLRFTFRELGYEKVSLTVFADNTRAVRLYERLGFQHEARRRSQYYTDGRRWDELWMGLTRAEYEAQHAAWFPDDTGLPFGDAAAPQSPGA